MEDSTADTEEIQRVVRTYFKNLYSIKLENLKETDNIRQGSDKQFKQTHNT